MVIDEIPTDKVRIIMSPAEAEGIGDRAYFDTWYKGRTPDFYTGILREIIQFGRPGTILDLGCGAGFFMELATQWGIDVWGIDGSHAALKLALERVPTLKVRQWHLSNSLPFPEQSFDNVLLNQVVEHLPPTVLVTVLSECYRILRPEGVVFVFSPAKANRAEVEKDPTHCNPLHPSELRNYLRSAGLVIVQEPNSARFFQHRPLLSKLMKRILRTAAEDWLSGTANAYAKRP